MHAKTSQSQIGHIDILDLLRGAVLQGEGGRHYARAKRIMAAYDALECVMDSLMQRQRERVTELVDKLQNLKGAAPTIILRLIFDPKILSVLISELEYEIHVELERLRIEMLQERRKRLFEAFLLMQLWQHELVCRERMSCSSVRAQVSTSHEICASPEVDHSSMEVESEELEFSMTFGV